MVHDPPSTTDHILALPLQVVGPVDLGRIIREIQTLSDTIHQESLRSKTSPKAPKTSRLMDQILELNKLDLMDNKDRQHLQKYLLLIRDQAPVLHISFSADPSVIFTEKLMTWLRREIHPLLLMTIGLQPNLGAGCVVRSTNKYFDFSLRENFRNKSDLLISKLREKN